MLTQQRRRVRIEAFRLLLSLPCHRQLTAPVIIWNGRRVELLGIHVSPAQVALQLPGRNGKGLPLSFRHGSMINAPSITAEFKVRDVSINRPGLTADVYRLKTIGLGHGNRAFDPEAGKVD